MRHRSSTRSRPGIRRRSILRGSVGLTLAVAAVSLAACSSGGAQSGSSGSAQGSGSSSSASDSTPIKIDVGPYAFSTLPWIAQEKGYFAQEHLNVDLISGTGGTTVQLPEVLSGALNIGVSGAADLMPAIAKGAPIELIAGPGSIYVTDPSKAGNVLFCKNAIASPRDLEGMSVAFQTLDSSNQLLTNLAVKDDGGDPSKIKYVQIPVQNIPEAIARGQVDCGQGLEPYATQARELGLHEVMAIGSAAPGDPEVSFFVAKSWAATHQAEIVAFAKAVGEAGVDANADISLVRSALIQYGKLSPDVANKMQNINHFAEGVTVAKYSGLASLLAANGQLATLPPVSNWVINTNSGG